MTASCPRSRGRTASIRCRSTASAAAIRARTSRRASSTESSPISTRSWRRTSFRARRRSEEHTSELQSLMRISYAVFCLKKKHQLNHHTIDTAHYTHIYQLMLHKCTLNHENNTNL